MIISIKTLCELFERVLQTSMSLVEGFCSRLRMKSVEKLEDWTIAQPSSYSTHRVSLCPSSYKAPQESDTRIPPSRTLNDIIRARTFRGRLTGKLDTKYSFIAVGLVCCCCVSLYLDTLIPCLAPVGDIDSPIVLDFVSHLLRSIKPPCLK